MNNDIEVNYTRTGRVPTAPGETTEFVGLFTLAGGAIEGAFQGTLTVSQDGAWVHAQLRVSVPGMSWNYDKLDSAMTHTASLRPAALRLVGVSSVVLGALSQLTSEMADLAQRVEEEARAATRTGAATH